MLAKLKMALGAAVLSGFFVVAADNGSRVAVAADPLALTAQEIEEFRDLIDPATFNMDALVAWLETLRENHPDPGVIEGFFLDLVLLVEDNNPLQDILFTMFQDEFATAAGPAAGPRGFVLRADTASLSENPSTDDPSPID